MKRLAAVVLAVAMLLPAPTFAQSGQAPLASDKDSLPVSLKRIKRGLQEAQSHPPANRLQALILRGGRWRKQANRVCSRISTPFTARCRSPLRRIKSCSIRSRRASFARRPPIMLGAAVWLGTKLAKKAADNRKK